MKTPAKITIYPQGTNNQVADWNLGDLPTEYTIRVLQSIIKKLSEQPSATTTTQLKSEHSG